LSFDEADVAAACEAGNLYFNRKAHDIEKGYKKRGVSSKEAEPRAWATVNKSDRGGRKKGGGRRRKKRSKSSSRKSGEKRVAEG
jgi:hypothetical protein